jgi:DNA (cytosine-5)-methyltransferase 1
MIGATFIDIFAGAGGLSEGFERAGFVSVAQIESDRNACMTLMTRAAYNHLKKGGRIEIYNRYVRGEITRDELYKNIPDHVLKTVINRKITKKNTKSLFDAVKANMTSLGFKTLDVLIGGPPCQAYSLVGRARDPHGKSYDHKNHLYKRYADFLDEFNPKIFVFENVPGMMSVHRGQMFKRIKARLDEAGKSGFRTEVRFLNSEDFGVLQCRRRVIIIGIRKDLDVSFSDFSVSKNTGLVNDILEDLPKLEAGGGNIWDEYTKPTNRYLMASNIRQDNDILSMHMTRPINDNDKKIYRIAIETWNNGGKRLKYNNLPKSLIKHNNKKYFLDRFKVVASDLPFAQTVVAHIAKDGHYYIHPDINQVRSLSVREAARLQSFPDNYYFEGSRSSKLTQIGNAVPPLMAEGVAEKVREMIS